MAEDSISIVHSKIEHIKQIACLHKYGIYKGFISTLGIDFLTLLYKSLINNPYVVVLSALSKSEVVGFICASESTELAYKYTLKKDALCFVSVLVVNLFKWDTLKYIFETLLYNKLIKKKCKKDVEVNGLKAELLSIAVDADFRKKGIGCLLIHQVEEYFKKNEIYEYKVVVLKAYENSNSFYQRNGFKFIREIIYHDRPEMLYVKSIKK